MDAVFDDFKQGYLSMSGYILAGSLSPLTPPERPNKLREFFQSTNHQNVQKDIQYAILYDKSSPLSLEPEQGKAWVEVFVAYWKAVGMILKAEEATANRYAVSFDPQNPYVYDLSDVFSVLLITTTNDSIDCYPMNKLSLRSFDITCS